MELNYDILSNMYAKRGYEFFTQPYKCNPFGIRRANPTVNEFNDVLGIAYVDMLGVKQCLMFKGSTLPGLFYLKNKLGNINGTAILQPGQHKNAWMFDYHHLGKPNQYEAFRQAAPGVFPVWRDNDSDGQLDMSGPTHRDVVGLNGHHAADSNLVGPYSAGCQIVQDKEEHQIWIAPARKHKEVHTNLFHYTLFVEG
jgi:hypothetical protein